MPKQKTVVKLLYATVIAVDICIDFGILVLLSTVYILSIYLTPTTEHEACTTSTC